MLKRYTDIKDKLLCIKNPARKKAVAVMNALVDDIEFSDISDYDGIESISDTLYKNADLLSVQLDEIINKNSSDFSLVEEIIDRTRRLIKDRNLIIKFGRN